MPDQIFSDTLQIGLVVRDLDASIRTYFHEYGIGPWRIFEIGPGSVANMVKDDKPAEFAMRIGLAMVGKVEWELIQPLDDKSQYAEFLASKGEGVHHVALATEDYASALQSLRDKGHSVVMGGVKDGITFTYLSTDRDLGVITEIHDLSGSGELQPDGVYPPEVD